MFGCSYLLRTEGLVCREVSGCCLKLHCCTPGLVRTSAGSTSYKGTTSPIHIEPLLLLLLLLLFTAIEFSLGGISPNTSNKKE